MAGLAMPGTSQNTLNLVHIFLIVSGYNRGTEMFRSNAT